MNEYKTTPHQKQKIEELLSAHPYQLVLYLAMFGSGILFLFILIALLATTNSLDIYWSRYFSYSTGILLISSYPASRLRFLFETERYGRLVRSLVSTLLFGLLFGILQLFGWSEMQANLSPDAVQRQSEFMYVLSGLHLIHLVAVLGVTTYFTIYFAKKLSNPIQKLVVGTNPFEGLRLSMISQVWLFLHVVWAVIFIAFLAGQA